MPEILGRLRPPRLASTPATPAVGEEYYDTGTNMLFWWNGTAWVAALTILRTSHTWAISGAVSAATLPPIFVPKVAGQATTLVSVRSLLGSGTSVACQMTYNGANLGSAITATTTALSTTFSQVIADLDRLGVVLSSPTGSPTNLSLSAILEHKAG